MINIRSAKQMDIDRGEMIYNHIHDEEEKGYGKAFVSFYEEYAKQHNCRKLCMDTNMINQRDRKMYHNLGYQEVDIVPCVFNGIPDVQLVCLEKYTS